MHDTRCLGWCTGMTQRDGMGREEGGGFRMGNTCIPVADSFELVGYAIASSGHSPRVLEAALLAELHRLARAPIAAAEMDKVRTRLLTAALASRQTPQGLASAIGEAVVVYGDVRAADRRLAQLRAVAAADVQRVLEQYVLHAHRVTIDRKSTR